jgi:hypothetical protein
VSGVSNEACFAVICFLNFNWWLVMALLGRAQLINHLEKGWYGMHELAAQAMLAMVSLTSTELYYICNVATHSLRPAGQQQQQQRHLQLRLQPGSQ